MVIRSVIFVLGIVPFCIEKWEKIQGVSSAVTFR